MGGGSYRNNLDQSSGCSRAGANSLLKGHRCLCLTRRPRSCFHVRSRVVSLPAALSHPGEPPGWCPAGVCCGCHGGGDQSREQPCRRGGKQPLGGHLGEGEMPSPEPIARDGQGKQGACEGARPLQGPLRTLVSCEGWEVPAWGSCSPCPLPASAEAAKGTVSSLRASRRAPSKPALAFQLHCLRGAPRSPGSGLPSCPVFSRRMHGACSDCHPRDLGIPWRRFGRGNFLTGANFCDTKLLL